MSISLALTAWRSSSSVIGGRYPRRAFARNDVRRLTRAHRVHRLVIGLDQWSSLIDTGAGRPAYQQIEAQVADAIAAGTLGAGDRLPPERDLAVRLGVSRMTVRQAFDALARRGLVERGVGRGTFVAAPRVEIDRTERVAGFTEQMERAGLEPGATVLSRRGHPRARARSRGRSGWRRARPSRACGACARAAACRSRSRTRGCRTRSSRASPTWISAARSTRSWATRYGHAPVRAVERLEPVAARAQDAEALGVRARTPLMRVERVAYDAEGNAVEYAEDRHRGDRARFVVEVAPRG